VKNLLIGILFFSLVFVPHVEAQTSACDRGQDILQQELTFCDRPDRPLTKGEFVWLLSQVAYDSGRVDRRAVSESDALDLCLERGFLRGEGNNQSTLGRVLPLNRATAVTLLVRVFPKLSSYPSSAEFEDLQGVQWYTESARRLVRSGTIVGLKRDDLRLFGADELLTGGDAVSLVFQALRAVTVLEETRDGVPHLSSLLARDPFERSSSVDEDFRAMKVPLANRVIPAGANAVEMVQYELTGQGTFEELVFERSGPGRETDFIGLSVSVYEGEYSVRVSSSRVISAESQQVRFPVQIDLRGKLLIALMASLSPTASASSVHDFTLVEVTIDGKVIDLSMDKTAASVMLATVSTGVVEMKNNGALNNLLRKPEDVVTRWELNMMGSEGGDLESITLRISGTVGTESISNFRLFVDRYSAPIARVDQVTENGLVNLRVCVPESLSCEPVRMERGETEVFYLMADLSQVRHQRSIEFELEEPSDLVVRGHASGFPLRVDSRDFGTRAVAF